MDFSIDCARAMGILFVVAGHAQGPWPLEKAIYSLHMPLFFLLSGHLSNPAPLYQLIIKKSKTLLAPFVLTALVSFLCFGNGSWAKLDTWRQLVIGLATGGSEGTLAFNSPLWFLPALFTVFVLHALASGLSRNVAIVVLLASLGAWFASVVHHPAMHMLRLDTALFSYPFFLLGVFMRKLPRIGPDIAGNDRSRIFGLVMAALLVAVIWVAARILDHNAYYVLGHNKVDPLVLFYLNGFSGAVMLFLCAKLAAAGLASVSHQIFSTLSLRWISNLSAASFGIYLLHKPLMLSFVPLLRDTVTNSGIMFMVLTVLGIGTPLLALSVLRRISPGFHAALLGNRRPRPA